MEAKPTYSAIGFDVFSGSKTRSECRSFKAGLENFEFDPASKLSSTPKFLSNEKPASTFAVSTSHSPKDDPGNYLIIDPDVTYNNDMESSPILNVSKNMVSSLGILDNRNDYQQHDPFQENNDDDDNELEIIWTSNSITPDSTSPSKINFSSKEPLTSKPQQSTVCTQNISSSSPESKQPNCYFSAIDNGVDSTIKNTNNKILDNNMDEAESSNSNNNSSSHLTGVQRIYNSSKTTVLSPLSEIKLTNSSLAINRVIKGCTCYAIEFPGKIIFGRNGSIYVVEDDCSNNWETLSKSLVHGGDQLKDSASIPVSSVTFFPKRNASIVIHTVKEGDEVRKPNPEFVSYLVFDIGTRDSEFLLNLHLSSDKYEPLAEHPILLCFVCKLLFVNRKSFLQHSILCHNLILNMGEKMLFSGYNASVITHVGGNNNAARLLLLYPVSDIYTASLGNGELSVSLKKKLVNYIKTNAHLFSQQRTTLYNREKNEVTFYDKALPTLKTNNQKCYSKSSLKLDIKSSFDEMTPGLFNYIKTLKMDDSSNSNSELSSPCSASDEGPTKPSLPSTLSALNPVSDAFKQRLSEFSLLSSQSSILPLSSSKSFSKSTTSTSNLEVIPMPTFSLPSMNSSNIMNSLSNIQSGPSLFYQGSGFQMPKFLYTCENHAQGKPPGLECSQCELTLISSAPLDSSNAIPHSRNSCKTLKCPKCNWHYKYHETLEIHMKEKHPDNESQCVYCIASQIHPRLARGETYSCGYKPYRCDVCNYSTTTKGNLSIHMQSDKHINNIQDLAAGNSEPKQQTPQLHLHQPTPTTNLFSKSCSSLPQEDHQSEDLHLTQEKQKQVFRCGICNYETSIARNLRIHMTSEKHTQKAMLMSQSLNHLHQDMAYHHANQLKKIIAKTEQESHFIANNHKMLNPLFFIEENSTTASSSSAHASTGFNQLTFEDNANNAKENIHDECDHLISNIDSSKMFQCCICSKYASDSLENVLSHIKYDRTKFSRVDSYTSFNNGTYMCNLCSYKTHLKANFHLHCKTDKHLQKLQFVVHVMEGGPANEYKMWQSVSSAQICCNACSFHTNSAQKIEYHLASSEHGSSAKLFRHLRLLEHASVSPGPNNIRCYHCKLCEISVPTKHRLVAHSKTALHLKNEKSLHQSHLSMFDVYHVKEMPKGEDIGSNKIDADNDAAHQNSFKSLTIAKNTKDLEHSSSSTLKTSTSPASSSSPSPSSSSSSIVQDLAASTITALEDGTGTNVSILGIEFPDDIYKQYDNGNNSEAKDGQFHTVAVASKISGSGPTSQVSTRSSSFFKETVKPVINGDNQGSGGRQPSSSSDNSLSTAVQFDSTPGAGLTHSQYILCPLCRHECADERALSEHLITSHNVVQEGVDKILSMITMTSSLSSSSSTRHKPSSSSSSISLPSSSYNGNKNSSEPDSLSSLSFTHSITTYVKETAQIKSVVNSLDKLKSKATSTILEKNINETTPEAFSSNPITHASSHYSSSTSSPTSSSSSSVAATLAASSPIIAISNPAPTSSLSNHLPATGARENATLSLKNLDREINLELLEAENANLLSTEAIDLGLHEQLDKEQENMYLCQICGKPFTEIDRLFDHQNELGHLILKLMPRGPGYLCWKKGCNQYFKTASTLQIHFKEIHAKTSPIDTLTPMEAELYKFNCRQCNYSFKSLAAMQKHTLIHLIQSVVQCKICFQKFNSVRKMENHFQTDHRSLGLSDINLHIERIKTNASLLFDTSDSEQFISNILLKNGNSKSKNGFSNIVEVLVEGGSLNNSSSVQENKDHFKDSFNSNKNEIESYDHIMITDEKFVSLHEAEDFYKSSECKFKCNSCKMGFSDELSLVAHKKTIFHKDRKQAELKREYFNSHVMYYKCGVCKEAFAQKSELQDHLSTASHLNKLKQYSSFVNDSHPFAQVSPYLLSNSSVSSHSVNKISSSHQINPDTGSDNSSGSNIKTFRCNICKVGYTNMSAFENHVRSSGHKNMSSRLDELIQSGQLDASQALIEHPDPRIAGQHHAQIIADIIHQQASAQALSPSSFNLQSLQGVNAVASDLAQAHKDALYALMRSQYNDELNFASKLSISNEYHKEKKPQTHSNPGESDTAIVTAQKNDIKVESTLIESQVMAVSNIKGQLESKSSKKEDDLPPNFNAPIIARPRGFMGRFKPQLYKSLLENFGFECAMLYNEENTRNNNDDYGKDDEAEATDNKNGNTINNEDLNKNEKMSDDGKVKKEDDECVKNIEPEDKNGNVALIKDDIKNSVDITEVSKQQCKTCHKDFSNIWVLKNHEEKSHDLTISPETIEEFGQKFKAEWIKNFPRPQEQEFASNPHIFSNATTPTANSAADNMPTKEMPPPKPPVPPPLPSHFELSQLFPFVGLNLLPMHLPMNLVNLGLPNSLMPSLMLPNMDIPQSFLPHMPALPCAESPTSINTHQQFLTASSSNNSYNQKRVRTRISDDQLKVLRQYFDINNSPSEDQINKMANQTGLPQKVIKHWFRNTLFKERQRNKDSPYNFNNPPSTSIDLDEYDRTGKIPEIKLELDDDYDGDSIQVLELKEEQQSAHESTSDKHRDEEGDSFNSNPLQIDLTPKKETAEEVRKDQDSYSNSSSPFISSIPSTPNGSVSPTPTPINSANTITATNPFTFSIDSYAANISRMEAAAFHNLGKRANRTRFTDYQIKTLQDYFERNAYPKDDELEHLSKNLGLSARVIVVWFQNARQKARKTYDNHPLNEGSKDALIPFQRTPGLNYQCKKCNSVHKRYYELIKHQKHCCLGEPSNNRVAMSMGEDDSNFSYSNDDFSFSDRQSTPAPVYKERELQIRPHEPHSIPTTPISKTPRASSTPLAASPQSLTPSYPAAYKHAKSPTTFARLDPWHDQPKTHVNNPNVYLPYFPASIYGPPQSSCQQDDFCKSTPTSASNAASSSLMPNSLHTPASSLDLSSATRATPTSSLSLSPSSKRKTDSEDDSGEQPKDKRLRTTILPEQLDYLYQQYQIDCNPSRKQLEHIALTVNLKKRVVQVWFQNTRARERKGHYRSHQQLINKRCPFCKALFRAKSALESHLATKHPDEVARGNINVDLIPDAPFDAIASQIPNSLASFSSGHDSAQSHSSKQITEMHKFPGHSQNASAMPNYINLMQQQGGFNIPFPGPNPDMLRHIPFEDNFFKKYLNDMVNNISGRQEHQMPQFHGHLQSPDPVVAHPNSKSQTHQPSSLPQLPRPLDTTTKIPTTSLPASIPSHIDVPLDLSKPAKTAEARHDVAAASRSSVSSHSELNEPQREMNYVQRVNSLDESFSETQSEVTDNEYTNDPGTNPQSPSHNSNNINHIPGTPCSIGKRYRTQMSAAQVKVMKSLFQDYKTPTMSECELLGHEIGLAKRVVQVWFQNARAKEKKAKLNSSNAFNPETDFPKVPEECKLCGYKYTHKVTVQDHIFTKAHIDRVKAFLNSKGFADNDMCNSDYQNLSYSMGDVDPHHHQIWEGAMPNRHLDQQLHAREQNSGTAGFSINQDERMMKNQESEIQRKEKKSHESIVKDEQKQHNQATLELAMNVQMLSALGGYMPGLEPAYMPYMYGGLPGYFPGMGLPVMQPGLIPDHMMAFDSLTYGTPLTLLQIPPAAIKSISEKVSETGAVLARYTQDCQALADLHNIVAPADLTVAAEATLDVGYICKKCHMVYPARESCLAHQKSVCLSNKPQHSKEFESIIKLEQIQYECRACRERFSTILEFKSHCQQESHKHSLIKFKSREAAKQESAESPTSSAPYTPSSGNIASSPNYIKPFTTSPSNNNNNNNNNNRIHNNNQVISPDNVKNWKPNMIKPLTPTSSKSSPNAASLHNDRYLPLPSPNYLT